MTAFQPEHFINRELSSLEFNSRVLEEAEDVTNPLLERVKFLAIFSSNLDEFFMIRVAGLREQAFGAGASEDRAADGMSSLAQLQAICRRTRELIARQYECWNNSVFPALRETGIEILRYEHLDDQQHALVDRFFHNTASLALTPMAIDCTASFVLTPMAIDLSHPSPRFHSQGLYLAAHLDRHDGSGPRQLFAVMQLPAVLPRLVRLGQDGETKYIFLEEILASRLPQLFGGYDVADWTTFRITRDSDLELLDKEADDMLDLIEDRIRARRRADAVRLEIPAGAGVEFVKRLIDSEEIHVAHDSKPDGYSEVYYIPGSLDLSSLMKLAAIPNFDHLRDTRFVPRAVKRLEACSSDQLFEEIARRDILLHHPYESFEPVVRFVRQAATDPKVLAIKQTLYRTSGDSPIVRALIEAAENGKHVTAIVELQARFDEAANVNWARKLERAGVHVVYGFMDLKTHCKLSLVVRRDDQTLTRYVHLSTGNYHPATAKVYTDLGLFTADENVAADASALFNLLTGHSQGDHWRKLVVAPEDLHRRTIELIEEQAQRARDGRPARVFAKLNSLVDQEVIAALYRASQVGVPIELVVRGICCLRPQMSGISDHITVRSIVDRFLEHSRICVFGPDEEAMVFVSSADWMPRNFFRRVEVMFPIEDVDARERILKEIIPVYLRDNQRSWILRPDGNYDRVVPQHEAPPYHCQEELLQISTKHNSDESTRSSRPSMTLNN